MINVNEILENHFEFLGEELEEKVKNYSKELIEKVLEQAAENAEIEIDFVDFTGTNFKVNEQSILDVINQIKWK